MVRSPSMRLSSEVVENCRRCQNDHLRFSEKICEQIELMIGVLKMTAHHGSSTDLKLLFLALGVCECH